MSSKLFVSSWQFARSRPCYSEQAAFIKESSVSSFYIGLVILSKIPREYSQYQAQVKKITNSQAVRRSLNGFER